MTAKPESVESITPEQIAEWRKERDKGMVSAVGEYTPDEFWLVLDAYEALVARHRAELAEALKEKRHPCCLKRPDCERHPDGYCARCHERLYP